MTNVSIHAPVRERRAEMRKYEGTKCFNSRSREGATKLFCFFKIKVGFNSRSREGATCAVFAQPIIKCVSIHAPVRERRLSPEAETRHWKFQFTLP